MKFQFVIQMNESYVPCFDDLISLEERLIESLGGIAAVDGHDYGNGEANIFIHTDNPIATFGRVGDALDLTAGCRVAFREFGQEGFTILYPDNLKEFSIS